MPSTTPVWRENLPLKIVNVLAYLFFLSSNAYSSLSPSSYSTGGRYSSAGSMETYVTPSPWIFLVWPLIHTLLLGMIILQFFPSGHSIVSNVVGWRFPILSVLTSVYAGLNTASARYDHHHHNGGGGHHGGGDGIHLRSRVYAICAFIALLLSAGVVSHIYRDLQVHSSSSSSSSSALPTNSNSTTRQRTTWLQLLFIHTPYSLYHGFLVVLLVVSGFAAFGTNAETHAHAGIISKILVFLALLFLEATAAGYVFYGKGDIVGALVISLSLLAIFQHQRTDRFIHWSALVFFLISLLAVVRATIASFQASRGSGRVRLGGSEGERAPLVG